MFLLLLVPFYAVLLNGFAFVVPHKLLRNVEYPLAGHGHMFSRIRDVEEAGRVDVLFLGSSHAYRGFDPRIFAAHGWSSFNLGSSGGSPLQTEVMVARYLERLDPELVLYEVHASRFQDEGLESTLDLVANGGMDAPTWELVMRLRHVKALNAALHATGRALLNSDANVEQPAVKRGDRYIGYGYVEHEGADFEREGWLKPQAVTYRDDQVGAFERTLAKLREDGRKVVLIEAPVTKWLRTSYREHEVFAQRMDHITPYLDFSGMAGLEDSLHFYTKGHLNQAGVEIFNRVLIDSLHARGFLPTASSAVH
ncbi:MAG: hypothetical protein KA941_12110 [Flavobacteriales bacterium]|nr:hypothetical protein [Flavobacteriales bacterium]